MIRMDYDISDEDFEEVNQPFIEDIHQYVRNNFIFEYLAYYIATGYRNDALWAGKLSGLFNGAIDELCGLQFGLNGDIERLREILKDSFNYLFRCFINISLIR